MAAIGSRICLSRPHTKEELSTGAVFDQGVQCAQIDKDIRDGTCIKVPCLAEGKINNRSFYYICSLCDMPICSADPFLGSKSNLSLVKSEGSSENLHSTVDGNIMSWRNNLNTTLTNVSMNLFSDVECTGYSSCALSGEATLPPSDCEGSSQPVHSRKPPKKRIFETKLHFKSVASLKSARLPEGWQRSFENKNLVFSFYDGCDQPKYSIGVLYDMSLRICYYGWKAPRSSCIYSLDITTQTLHGTIKDIESFSICSGLYSSGSGLPHMTTKSMTPFSSENTPTVRKLAYR
ncbi:unnamed protein product [Clavelina lepadiformis]|uniref:Uncharacterized protein n=1 Tax=Clavelina lepadiformis TaxID=159417 RepID=A0ABP0FNE3_CLALP